MTTFLITHQESSIKYFTGSAAHPAKILRMNFVYFDVETKRLADEVGGWSNIEQLGIAVAVTLSSRDNIFRVYRENETTALLDELRAADCVVGFNSRGFDFRVVQPFVDFDLRGLPNIDLMIDLKQVLGFRVGLDNVCAATLGQGKSSHGTESVQWWRDGRENEVIEYCKQDVQLTRLLHEYGATHQHVFYMDKKGAKRTATVPWSLTAIANAPAQGSLF